MAWTIPRTWTIGEKVTKTIMDTHVRDNLNWLKDRIVFLDNRLTNSGYDGDAVTTGTYTFTANNFNSGLPNEAQALFMSVSAAWAAASNGSYCNILNVDGFTNSCLIVRAQVANFFQDANGVVTLDASGQFKIIVAGANTTGLYINVWGYVL